MTRIIIKLDDELIQQVKRAAAEAKMTQNQWLEQVTGPTANFQKLSIVSLGRQKDRSHLIQS